MADEPTPPESQQQSSNLSVTVDERELRTIYSNFYRIFTAPEEVVIDFCFTMPHPQQSGPPQMTVKVTDRMVVSYATAKRLAGSLAQLIKRYEQQFGEINVQGVQRRE
jgi:hypothetical protein